MALVGEGDWNRRPGGQAAAARHQRVRPAGTREKYDRWVVFWQEFCRLGGPGGAYPEFEWEELTPLNKFKLFLGWLEETRRTVDRNAQGIASALNRHFSDHGRGRPFKGVDVQAEIKQWAVDRDDDKRAAGLEPGLNRVPCPEAAVRRLIERGETVHGVQLARCCCLVVQLLGWLRADSVAGMRPGDIAFDEAGALVLLIRWMKLRPAFKLNPGVIQIPAAGWPAHWRARAFGVLRRGLALPRHFLFTLTSLPPPSKEGGAYAAGGLTGWLRELVQGLPLPANAVVGSHSWREMACVSCWKAQPRKCVIAMQERGFWKKFQTMYGSYIEPFLWFPRSLLLAELYDDLSL